MADKKPDQPGSSGGPEPASPPFSVAVAHQDEFSKTEPPQNGLANGTPPLQQPDSTLPNQAQPLQPPYSRLSMPPAGRQAEPALYQ